MKNKITQITNKSRIRDLFREEDFIRADLILAKALGLNSAILLQELISYEEYIESRDLLDEEGFFHDIVQNIWKKKALSSSEQKTAREKLVDLELIEIKRKDIPAKLYYKCNYNKIEEFREAAKKGINKEEERLNKDPKRLPNCKNVKIQHPVVQKEQPGCTNSSINKDNNKDNTISSEIDKSISSEIARSSKSRTRKKSSKKEENSGKESPGKIENEIIDLFEPINSSYQLFFTDHIQRGFIKKLLKIHSKEEIVLQLQKVKKIKQNPEKYAPTIYTPAELYTKWDKIEYYFASKKNKSNTAHRLEAPEGKYDNIKITHIDNREK